MKLTDQLLVIGAVNKVVKINGDPWCTNEEIKQLCGLSSKKVVFLLENLIDEGLLEHYKNGYRQSIWINGHDRFVVLMDNAQEALLVVQDFRIQFVNRKMIRVTCYSLEEMMSKSFKEFVHPDDLIAMESRHSNSTKEFFSSTWLDSSTSFRFVDKDHSIKQAIEGRICVSDLACWGKTLDASNDSHMHIVLIS